MIEILQNIRHQPVLTEDHNCIPLSENEIGNICAIDALEPAESRKYILRIPHCTLVLPVLKLVVRKISPKVLDVKSRLVFSVESGDELVETGPANHKNDFVLSKTFHYPD